MPTRGGDRWAAFERSDGVVMRGTWVILDEPTPTQHFDDVRKLRSFRGSRTALPAFDPFRIIEHIHGHLGWLAAIALVHPAILLRRARRRAHWAVGLAVGVVTLAAVLGVIMYPAYRDQLRQPIFAGSSAVGYLFERKEHLAFGVVMLAWAGGIAYAGASLSEGDARDALRVFAHRAFVAAAALAVATAALGTVVAAYKTF